MSRKDISARLGGLKAEAAAEIGMTQFVKENNDHYKGDMSAKQNGAQGGPIGGEMVRKMIRSAEEKLENGKS